MESLVALVWQCPVFYFPYPKAFRLRLSDYKSYPAVRIGAAVCMHVFKGKPDDWAGPYSVFLGLALFGLHWDDL